MPNTNQQQNELVLTENGTRRNDSNGGSQTQRMEEMYENLIRGSMANNSSPIMDVLERRYHTGQLRWRTVDEIIDSERQTSAIELAREIVNINNVQDSGRARPLEIIGAPGTSANINMCNQFSRELNDMYIRHMNLPAEQPASNPERRSGQHVSFEPLNVNIRDLYPSIMSPPCQNHPVSDPSETPNSNQTERERVTGRYAGRGVIASFIPITLQESTETNSEDDDIDYIQSYNYIPDNYIFRKVSDEEELYMGIELEIDKGGEDESSAKFVYNHMNKDGDLVYCKSDSSLDDGFEIVTHPCTFEYHTKIKPMYKSLFKQLSDMKYKADFVSSCGFHVHINRNYFGKRKIDQDLGIGKFVYLFSKYLKEITVIARRQTNQYAAEISLEKGDSIITAYANAIDIGKYSCVNLMHKNTVEIRLFQGTLNCNIFLLTLEFVKKLAEIARNADIYDMDSITWDDIKNTFSDDLVLYIDNCNKKQNAKKSKNNTNNLVTFTASTVNRVVHNSGTNLLRRLADSYIGINPFRDDPPLAGARGLGIDTSAIGTLIDNPNRNSVPMYMMDSLGTITERPVVVNLPRELTEEEKITKDITDLKAKLKRCRNDFERMNINRSIAKLERELHIIRHRPIARAQ